LIRAIHPLEQIAEIKVAESEGLPTGGMLQIKPWRGVYPPEGGCEVRGFREEEYPVFTRFHARAGNEARIDG